MKTALLFLITTTTALLSSSTFLQGFNITSSPTSNITISGSPRPLTVSLGLDGTGSATDSSTSYTISSNTGNGKLKILGAITSGGNLPLNTSLQVSLSSTKGASQGLQVLTTNPIDLVRKIPSLISDSGSITYVFSVQNGWQIPAQTIQRTVTLTLTSGG